MAGNRGNEPKMMTLFAQIRINTLALSRDLHLLLTLLDDKRVE
jgi:hypothetical protein